MARRGTGSIIAWAAAVVLAAPGASFAGKRDPAPVSAEVLQRIIPQQSRSRSDSVPEQLERHLDAAQSFLGRLDEEGRGSQAGDQDPVLPTTATSLLASRLHELRSARTELGRAIAAMRARQGAADNRERRKWDEDVASIEQRVDGAIAALEAVDRARTHGERRRAMRAARADLDKLQEASRRQHERAPVDEPRSYSQRPNRWQAPAVASAPEPQYTRWAPRAQLAFAGQTLLDAGQELLAQAPPAEAHSCNYTAADLAETPDVQLTEDIRKLADSLGRSPAKIYQWVSNEIAFQPYYGSLKGAAGTLASRSGNATDHASLLIALLRASNIPARYVKGTIEMNDPRVQRWVGAKTYYAAAAIFSSGLVPTQPVTDASNTATGVRLIHVWVQACVPYGNYRGTAIDLSGHRWVPLDASFKDKTYQDGIATAVDFDYTGYLAKRGNTLPHEEYADEVTAYIKAQPPNFSNNTLDDVPYKGKPVPRTIDILPASLPYFVNGFNAWDTDLTAETAALPANHRYRWSLELWNGAGASLLQIPNLSMPEVVLQRITLSFQGATANDQTAIKAWRDDADLDAALPCATNVVPVVKVDGVTRTLGGTPVPICSTNNRLTMRVFLDEVTLGTTQGDLNSVTFNAIQAADYYALFAYAFQASDEVLAARAAKLLKAVQDNANPNDNLEDTEGEFLHLVGMKYMRGITDGAKQIGELDGGSGESGNHLGLTSSRMKVSYVFDRPFAIFRGGFVVDVPGGQGRNFDITTGAPVWKTFLLSSYMASAYESWIWQSNAQLDAVSTVRGIQFARENAIEMLTISSANQSSQIPKLTSNADAALNYPAAQVSALQGWVNQGYTVSAPRSAIQYDNWKGTVWVTEKNDSATTGEMVAGFIIDGTFAGGYTTARVTVTTYVDVYYDPVMDWGYVYTYTYVDVQPLFYYQPLFPPFGAYDPVSPFPIYTPSEPFLTPEQSSPILSSMDNGGPPRVSAGDPVNMVNGNMYHVERDVAIKGRGLPLVFERTYNSLLPKDGPLGFGWTHNYNHVLIFDDALPDGQTTAADSDNRTSSVTWVDGSGAVRFITVSGGDAGIAIGATFTPPAGFYFKVAREADGTYTIREKNGLTYTFESVAGKPRERARLLRISDRNGNALQLTYTGPNLTSVKDGLGRELTLTYNTSNRIIELRDWTGRRHQYTYDEANANLTEYRNPIAVGGAPAPVKYAYYNTAPLQHFMQSYTLPRGNGMNFEYYPNGRVFRHTNTLKESTTFTYNMMRREALSVNERGHARQYFFDPNGNLIKAVEEGNGEQIYTYDPANPFNRLSHKDPMGRVTSYAYDANGNVISRTAPSGNKVESSFFNSFGQPGKVKDARGNYAILKYDPKGNLLESIRLRSGVGADVNPVGFVPQAGDVVAWTINTYDSFGNVLTSKPVRDASTQAGPTLEFDYNDTANSVQGLNVVKITRRGDKDGNGTIDADEFDSVTLAYDALGRTTTGVRGDWYPTQAVYDLVDRVIRGTDDTGQLRDYAYDDNGNLIRQSLTLGSTLWDQQTFAYDQSDRRITSTNAAGNITQYRYDPAGNVIATTSSDGYTVRFEYDANNRPVTATDEEGHSVKRTLDLGGRPRAVTDPNGNSVKFEYYDSTRDGRLKLQRDAVGRATTLDYDANGNVTLATDNLGRTTLMSYDELDRAIRVVRPSLGTMRPVTRYAYDLLGNLTTVAAGSTDVAGTNPASDVVTNQMLYTWDDFGRKLSETDALGRVRRWTYDVQGNPLNATDAKLQTTQYTWGYGHLPATRRDNLGAVTIWTRNPLGQVTQVSSPAVTYTTTYDAAHRVATIADSRGATLSYHWSPGGRLAFYEDNQGNRKDYAYDNVGRLSGIWSSRGDLVTFIYDNGGRLTDKWFPNGVTTQYTWNPDNTLAKLVNAYRGNTLISQHEYFYDQVGNRATHNSFLTPNATSFHYSYDALNRLTGASAGAAAESYTYDALGNRLSKASGAAVTTYVYDAANQLTEWHQGAVDGPLLGGQVFDANGNVIKKCEGGTVAVSPTDCSGATITFMSYNALNQLSQTSQSNATTINTQTYVYDDQARRIRKTVNGVPINYLYMGSDIVGQYGSSMFSGPLAVFTHGPDVDAPIMRETAAGSQYYHQDGLGSVEAFTTPDGAVAGGNRYDAWGVRTSTFGTMPTYGFTGREPDETGLVYYRARYYDPTLARFTQQDPIGISGGLNLYAYVGNNPTNFTDPTGLIAASTSAAFGGGGEAGSGGKGASSGGVDNTFFNPGTTATSSDQNLGSFANNQPVQTACVGPALALCIRGAVIGSSLIAGGAINSSNTGGGKKNDDPFFSQGGGNSSPGSPDPKCGIFGIGCKQSEPVSGREQFGETRFSGLNQNRSLSELTHADVAKAFEGTQFTPSSHAIGRILDPRTRALGAETLNDIARLLNKGEVTPAGGGNVAVQLDRLEAIINPKTNVIITLRPL